MVTVYLAVTLLPLIERLQYMIYMSKRRNNPKRRCLNSNLD